MLKALFSPVQLLLTLWGKVRSKILIRYKRRCYLKRYDCFRIATIILSIYICYNIILYYSLGYNDKTSLKSQDMTSSAYFIEYPNPNQSRYYLKKSFKAFSPGLIMSSMLKFIEDEIKEALLQDKGKGCEMPHLDPFAKVVVQFDQKLPKLKCEQTDWVKCYHSECKVVDEVLSTTRNIICNYQDIIYENDFKYHLDPPIVVKEGDPYVLRKSDHVKIQCTGKHRFSIFMSIWSGYAIGFRKSVERKPVPLNRENTFNVLILAFDSASKNGFIRKMPKSYHYLKNVLQATILESYNIVGDGTPAALFPLLTGKTDLELPDARRFIVTDTLHNEHFIFHKLKEDGYRTAYFENSLRGTFTHRHNGFQHQPADHYLQSFLQLVNIKKCCIGDTLQHKFMLNITDQFLRLDGKRFCFTFIVNNNMISMVDDATTELFQTLFNSNTLEDTLLIVMGDHGMRYIQVRSTVQGRLEERLPLMSIRLPNKLTRLRASARAQLEENANSLTTPHDIHATVLDVLDWEQHINPYTVAGADFPRAMSLLRPIPRNRSCSEAGIHPLWCACVKWKNVTDHKLEQKAADAFIRFINGLTEPLRDQCVPRKLTLVQGLMTQETNAEVMLSPNSIDWKSYFRNFGYKLIVTKKQYQLKVVIGPGNSIYEAAFTHFLPRDRVMINPEGISRINAYGNESSCISDIYPHLNIFCYCRNYVPYGV